MKNKIFYLETKKGTFWYTEEDGNLFDSNERGFKFNSLNIPEGFDKKDLKQLTLDITVDSIIACSNNVVLNEK